MNLYSRAKSGLRRAFGYDAADDRGAGRRRDVSVAIYHEDLVATKQKRKILSGNSRDLVRNFNIVRWAVNKHLDYVTQFSFQAKTGDNAFDAALEGWMVRRSSRFRFDAAKRHNLARALRISEACRTVDGDVGWMKILRGPLSGTVQGVESDLIQNPPNSKGDWLNGVRLSRAGAAEKYGLFARDGRGYKFAREVPSDDLYLHGWFEDRFDQVRGISPVTSSLNSFRDVYEGMDFALAKLKVAQLFGLKIKRNATGAAWGTEEATEDADADGTNDSSYEVNLNRGPFQLDLEPGDDADFMESGTPATETVNYLKLMIQVALRSLDIPYSFLDESFTNFYGSRGGLIQYQKSCKRKLCDNQELLNWWTAWAIGLAVFTGELELPPGLIFGDIEWEWVPDGIPWWNPSQEARGEAMAVAMGASSPQRVCRERNTDFFQNIDEIAVAMEYAKSKGVPLTFADSSAFAPEITVGSSDET
jgi:capsid protein